jgi:voltage-gated potassium channel Kch
MTIFDSGSAGIQFRGNTILDSAGVSMRRMEVYGILKLASNLGQVAANGIEFGGGVIDLNGYDWTPGNSSANLSYFQSTNVKIIKSNGGEIILTGNNAQIVSAQTAYLIALLNDKATINCTYSGGVGTRTFQFNSGSSQLNVESFSNIIIKISSGTDIIAITNNPPTFDFTGFSGTLSNVANRRFMGDVTLSSTMSITAGNVWEPVTGPGRPYLFEAAGLTLETPVRVYAGLPGGIKFASATTFGTTRQLRYDFGLVDCNNYSISFGNILTSAAIPRAINVGSAGISLTGSSTTVFSANTPTYHFVLGSGGINCTYSGGTGTRTFDVGSTGNVPSAASAKYIPPLNFTAGTDIVAIAGGSRVYGDINFTGFSGTHTVQANNIWYGSPTFSGTMTLTASASAQQFNGNVTQNITTNGITIDFPITINQSGAGSFKLLGNTTIGSARTLTLTAGTIDLNNFNLSTGIFSSSNSNARTLTFGSGTFTIAGSGTSWNAATATNFTINGGTGTISMTSGSAKTFAGGGASYPKLNQGGAGSLSITGNNTFADITNTNPTACTIIFPNATTTVSEFNASGTSGNLLTLARTGASGTFTLSKTSGVVGVNYISVSNSVATGGATWYAGANSTDAGNNTGWIFANAPMSSGNMFFMFM